MNARTTPPVTKAAPPIRTERDALKYRLSYGLDGLAVTETRHLLNVLVENKSDSSRSNPLYARGATSAALEYRGSFDSGLDVQAGARFDVNDTFDDAATWNIGLSYPVGPSGVRLHASAGVGIVNPSYFELYATDFGYVGNPALTPERNTSFDVGVTWPVLDGRGTLDVTYFNEVLTDEITDVATGRRHLRLRQPVRRQQPAGGRGDGQPAGDGYARAADGLYLP